VTAGETCVQLPAASTGGEKRGNKRRDAVYIHVDHKPRTPPHFFSEEPRHAMCICVFTLYVSRGKHTETLRKRLMSHHIGHETSSKRVADDS
jgi:hypothetical protein